MSKPMFTGSKARFLNYKEDGLKQRSVTHRNLKKYSRKSKHQNQEG